MTNRTLSKFEVYLNDGKKVIVEAESLEDACEATNRKYKRKWITVIAINGEPC